MTETTRLLRPLDPGRVHSTDPLELDYWSREFGCSVAELEAAIEQVGEHVTALRGVLPKRPAPGAA